MPGIGKIKEERMSRMHDHGRLRRYRGFLMAIGMLSVLAASAQEFKPYPDAKVTVTQWQAYLDLVRKKVGSSEHSFPAQHLETYSNEACVYGPSARRKVKTLFATPLVTRTHPFFRNARRVP
jgi:hypothetical protein